MGEGILLVTFAYIPALIVAYNLGVADLVNTWPVEWSLGRFIVGGILTYFLLLVVVVFRILFTRIFFLNGLNQMNKRDFSYNSSTSNS
jgi:putative ABC transport system permease protein